MIHNEANAPLPEQPRRRTVDAVEEEIAFHLACSADELQQGGVSDRSEAEAIARKRFGDIEKIRLTCLKLAWKERLMEKVTSRPVLKYAAIAAGVGIVLFAVLSVRAQMAMAEEAYMRARHAEAEARQAMLEASQAREESAALNHILLEALSGVDPESPDLALTVRAILATASTRLESEFADDPEILERLTSAIEDARTSLQQLDELERSNSSSIESAPDHDAEIERDQ
ncbi:MAG: permease prefix domain 1-containing protein [Planctomycetota bacterium]